MNDKRKNSTKKSNSWLTRLRWLIEWIDWPDWLIVWLNREKRRWNQDNLNKRFEVIKMQGDSKEKKAGGFEPAAFWLTVRCNTGWTKEAVDEWVKWNVKISEEQWKRYSTSLEGVVDTSITGCVRLIFLGDVDDSMDWCNIQCMMMMSQCNESM